MKRNISMDDITIADLRSMVSEIDENNGNPYKIAWHGMNSSFIDLLSLLPTFVYKDKDGKIHTGSIEIGDNDDEVYFVKISFGGDNKSVRFNTFEEYNNIKCVGFWDANTFGYINNEGYELFIVKPHLTRSYRSMLIDKINEIKKKELQCIVIEEENAYTFQSRLNFLLNENYEIECSSCNSKIYKAVMIYKGDNVTND